MTYYSTLKEAFNVDTFSKKKIKEGFMNDYSPQDDCYYKNEYGVDTKVCSRPKVVSKFTNPSQQTAQQFIMNKPENKNNGNPAHIESSRIAMNSSEVSGYQSHQMNKQGDSCAPLQAPNYDFPLSGECKKEFEKAVKVYTNDNTINNISYEDFNKNTKYQNIQPYYDEDLEQYFDINNLNDEVKYKSNNPTFMPNYNKSGGYSNNNTSEYSNLTPNDNDDLLRTEAYNLSEEDKKNALQALGVLKNIEDKINNNKRIGNDAVKQGANNDKTIIQQPKVEEKSKKSTSFYSSLINIAIFIFIGIVIILLCDQMVELAIQLGMKKTVNILEPFMKMQEMQQQLQQHMQHMQQQIALQTAKVPQMPQAQLPQMPQVQLPQLPNNNI